MDRKKVLMIFGAAWVSAALLTWFLYATTRAPRVEKTIAVQAAARDMPAGTRLAKSDLKTVRFPEKDVPRMALLDEKQLLDRPLLFPVNANEPLTAAKVASVGGAEGVSSTIEVGKRAISVAITDTTGVSGLIQPRSHVDVLFTRTGAMTEAVTTTILEDVVVLAMGRTTEAPNASTPTAPVAAGTTAARALTATLLVTPEQTRVVELAKNQGRISLSLRNPLDRDTTGPGSTTAEALYAGALKGKGFSFGAARQVAPPPPPKPEPPKPVVIERPPPPKPKKVIDVFRGDKHVQETFNE
jgi:pilus assembly protein CpaB